MFRFLDILASSLAMALEEFRSNKLRTFLSLFGITIGIFCIIGVLATVNSLQQNVQNDMKKIGSNSIFLDKWEYKPNVEWWKLSKRPAIKFNEMKMLKQKVHSAEFMAFKIGTNDKVEYEDNLVSGVTYYGFSEEFPDIQKMDIGLGRYFQQSDYDHASNSIVLGYEVAEQLFGKAENAIGKQIEIRGKKGNVVGLIRKQGQSFMDMWKFDNCIIMPYGFLKTMAKEENASPMIIIKGYDNVSIAQLKDELTAAMRSIRKLKPTEEDNYSLNDIEPFKQLTENLFSGINTGGWAIAGLSLIVGMFGVANIMFVTVRERTSQIGLKKAIGAKRSTIMMEFLMESAFLCILGGAVGILLVFILTLIISSFLNFPIFISVGIMALAVSICIAIGILAGIIPASIAARMDPVV
ncbi:MAG: ABC transporter permease, partial [Chitinophagaceae bacterium]